MLAIQIMSSFALQSIPVLAPIAAPALGVSRNDVGYFMALVYGVAILSSSAGGLLAARFGAVRVSQGALLLSGAGIAMFGLGSVHAYDIGLHGHASIGAGTGANECTLAERQSQMSHR